ncbi:proline and serine-rich protein 2 [Rana temporaria]|uniref:proline and serine-rich protein 2 n=1 Tax=Rana temporaria TaxID=8407 RepID=UPI001AAE1255|nr:proline and serine-rich protein 2 [Rana temporaria]XP_040199325.1 proline and serine-rich protein 2 [Rana temporaria]
MPSNFLKLSSSSMESEFHNRSDFDRSGSFDSQGSHRSRTRSFNMDDENMKYLTNEEKNVLMFFEETLDAFEEDNEEPPILLNSSLGCYSLRTEDSHSDSDDIIDLVQRGHNHEGLLSDTGSGPNTNGQKNTQHDSRLLAVTGFASAPVVISTSAIQRVEDHFPSEPPIDYPKFHGAVPTPVILAQKISEKKTENVHLSSMSPKEEKSQELKKSVATSPVGDDHFVFPGSPNGKLNRFPNNISVKLSGKQYNKTIAKAAVNVQERKAQVLANLHGPTLFAEEIDGKNGEQLNRRTSFRDVPSEQSRYEALTKLGLVKEMPVQANMQTTSACTSPVSNGQHSPKFFPPEIKRRFSNEKVNANSQLSAKISTPEFNTKISNEHHVINGQNSSKFFTTETKRVPSIEKDNMSSQHLPKAEESNRRLSNEQINPRVSIKVLSPESSKKIPYGHDYNNGQNSSKYFTTETKRVPSIEKETMSSQHLPKAEESNRRLSNEQINPRVSIKVLSPESSKKIPYGHDYNNGQNSSKYFTTETKRVPSIEKETMSSQHLPKVLGEASSRRLSNEQESISKILRNEPSPFVPLGKTVVIKGETPASYIDKNKRHSSIYVNHEQKQPNHQEIKRTSSVPRPTGFRSQGITVQFSGRDSSEETRKDALRKLGLLKGQSGQ